MRRLVVIEYGSVDGAIQAPDHPGEDGEGGPSTGADRAQASSALRMATLKSRSVAG
jgi:hypothetical protein